MRRRHALALLGSGLLARPALAQSRTVVDSAKRAVTLPAKVERVFVAGPPASVLAYVLARDAMVGWIRQPSPAEKEFLAAPARDLPETGRLTGRGDTVSLERLVAAKPDLVLDFGSTTQTYVSLADRVQSQTGIPYVLIDGRFAATAESLKLAADVLGRQPRGATLAAYADKTLALVDGVLTKVPPDKRPRVYLARGPGGLETGARGSINTEIIERVGATNLVEGVGGRGNIATASMEQLIAWQPEIVITMDRAFFDGVKTKPGWDQVRAVKEGRVFLAPSLPWGWIDAPPSLNRLIGLRWLLQTFYPAEARLDLRADTRDFYGLFYGVTPSDAQLDRLLGGSH
ncbi:MAG: iron ABC transporter substrate-binding protein [Reyranella sp.]|uniref:iron ABC transporter substrate-binding protein n=1 Tax=Reyranella sp. TaxID=1929291 RepID=UPI001AC538C3|nr:iron ABC transporter substrate-binding protein [Reyranella sp.]MBN9088731.1 iron ABC transporter substrate-binding protein [Reyranella sp.]